MFSRGETIPICGHRYSSPSRTLQPLTRGEYLILVLVQHGEINKFRTERLSVGKRSKLFANMRIVLTNVSEIN